MSAPLVSGFTFIKNGLTLGYPILESIKSIEPLCDEIIINVGFDHEDLKSDDGTYEFLRDQLDHSKFRFLKNHWDPTKTQNGLILSEQTNLALAACQGKVCQYIQGDEVVHEDDYPAIHAAYLDLINHPDVMGLVFQYIHFYGNVDIVKQTRNIYRREVRAIKNDPQIKSWRDAQGFRFHNGHKLKSFETSAKIYHYGWARKDKIMAKKVKSMDRLYHGEKKDKEGFEYQKIWGLKPFQGKHPQVMQKWIETHRNDLDLLQMKLKWEKGLPGLILSDLIEGLTGKRIGEYKNFKLI